MERNSCTHAHTHTTQQHRFSKAQYQIGYLGKLQWKNDLLLHEYVTEYARIIARNIF